MCYNYLGGRHMSKKQILKNIQKDKNDNKKIDERDNYFKFITTLAILLLIFILAYFLIGLFYTKEIKFKSDDNEAKEEVYIDNDTMLLGQLFDKSDDEYYVLIYDTTSKESLVSTWISIYEGKTDAIKLYKVDSSKKFNAEYIVKENSNKNAKTLSDLKVISPTLIKIKNKSIIEYVEGEDEIINILKG